MPNVQDYIQGKLNGAQTEKIVVDDRPKTAREEEYLQIFTDVQQYITSNKLSELESSLDSGNDEVLIEVVRGYIGKKYRKISSDQALYDETVTKCVQDMTGYGFLNKYLARKDEVEEININAWNVIEVRWCNGTDEITDDKFHSPKHAKDVMNRLLRQTGRFLDENRIYEISYIGKSIRLTIVTSPIVDEEIGVAASIRFIHSAVFNLEKMVSNGFLTQQMGNDLVRCLNHGVSIIVCGSTGSGKTTMLNALLETVPPMTRVITLEGGTREFELIRHDENGKVNNNRVHMQTRPHKDPKLNVDLQLLLDLNLKFDPDIVIVGEMVSEEAFIASEMARTGHTVATTIHTNNAYDAYYRMFTLGIRKYTLEKNLMLKFMVDAFPIVVYCKKYPDGKRRIQCILEGHFEDDQIVYNELYHFDVEDNIVDEDGKVTTVGSFVHKNCVTEELKERMIDNGATRQLVADM